MLKRICKCGNSYQMGKQCSCQSKRHTIYDRYHRNKENATTYHRKEWALLTQICRDRCNGIDLYKLMTSGRIVIPKQGLCHHIIEVNEAPELIYDIDNLIYVGYDSHTEIHMLYRTKNKLELQKKLKIFLKNFVADAGG